MPKPGPWYPLRKEAHAQPFWPLPIQYLYKYRTRIPRFECCSWCAKKRLCNKYTLQPLPVLNLLISFNPTEHEQPERHPAMSCKRRWVSWKSRPLHTHSGLDSVDWLQRRNNTQKILWRVLLWNTLIPPRAKLLYGSKISVSYLFQRGFIYYATLTVQTLVKLTFLRS